MAGVSLTTAAMSKYGASTKEDEDRAAGRESIVGGIVSGLGGALSGGLTGFKVGGLWGGIIGAIGGLLINGLPGIISGINMNNVTDSRRIELKTKEIE